MTKERIKEIQSGCRYGEYKMAFRPKYVISDQYKTYPEGITESEDQEIRNHWKKRVASDSSLGWTTYSWALNDLGK